MVHYWTFVFAYYWYHQLMCVLSSHQPNYCNNTTTFTPLPPVLHCDHNHPCIPNNNLSDGENLLITSNISNSIVDWNENTTLYATVAEETIGIRALNKSGGEIAYLKEIETIKKDILEGLQIEEEGLFDVNIFDRSSATDRKQSFTSSSPAANHGAKVELKRRNYYPKNDGRNSKCNNNNNDNNNNDSSNNNNNRLGKHSNNNYSDGYALNSKCFVERMLDNRTFDCAVKLYREPHQHRSSSSSYGIRKLHLKCRSASYILTVRHDCTGRLHILNNGTTHYTNIHSREESLLLDDSSQLMAVVPLVDEIDKYSCFSVDRNNSSSTRKKRLRHRNNLKICCNRFAYYNNSDGNNSNCVFDYKIETWSSYQLLTRSDHNNNSSTNRRRDKFDKPVASSPPGSIKHNKNDSTLSSIGDSNSFTCVLMDDSDDDSTTTMTTMNERPYFLFSSRPKIDQNDADKKYRHRHRNRRAATGKKERIWDYGVIPYEIDSHFSSIHKSLFKQAMRHWENFTCIKFVERSPAEHPNYIIFTERPCGCCSFVGKRGNGAQAISIGKNCDKFGIVVHELGHVVGFWHEHTRPDRDHHVQIVREHIMTGQEYNFNKLTDEEVNSLGSPYDYDSIMHYAHNTFSKGTYLDTIQPIGNSAATATTAASGHGNDRSSSSKKKIEIGQRIRLSAGDIAQTKLLYKCPKCGRTFQEASANFSHYESNITTTVRCEWRITASYGEHIRLNITDINIFRSDQCSTDYLEVRDGYWQKSRLIGRYCGNGRIPDLITARSSRMLITHVISVANNKLRGFSANYEVVCGGDIFVKPSNIGHLESPSYPSEYQSNKDCLWTLSTEFGLQIALKFQSFEVENHDSCAYDYIEIRNGDNAESPLIGVYCGYKLPADILSSGNKMYVKFVSDGTVQKSGFSAYYMAEFDECSSAEHGCEQTCVNNVGSYECTCRLGYQLHSDNKRCEAACGGRIDAPNGTITSPSFPDIYPGNKSCVWEIIAPSQHRVTLNFTHFDLEGNTVECDYDRVEIYSKLSADQLRRHGIFCGNCLPATITSETNVLRIEFESDNSIHKSGFSATYVTDIDECSVNNGGCQHECRNTIGSYVCFCHNGFMLHENRHNCREGDCRYELTAEHGTITSPNYPDYYPSKKDCIWHFVATPGHRIKLVFDLFELESHQDCSYDHLVIYDGESTDSLMLGRYCGVRIPHPIVSSSNQLYMLFKSDSSVQRKGFTSTYSTVCGGKLRATGHVKHFYSHYKYGHEQYDNEIDCEWIIEADYACNIHLTFLTFDLEQENECIYDFVEVYGGQDVNGQFYGKFCGTSIPSNIVSSNDAMMVHFKTDNTVLGKGFSVSYVAVDPASDELLISS